MFDLNLKNRKLAALLAWLVPGAGHLYQGRTTKGLLLMICISSTFLFGFYVGGGKVAYATPISIDQLRQANPGASSLSLRFTQLKDRWPFICQAGIGSVALPGIIERQRFLNGKTELFGGAFRPPISRPVEFPDESGNTVTQPDELGKWNYTLGFSFELGTMYTVVAGLLNILAVYDAHSGPLIMKMVDDEGPAPNDDAGKT